MKIIIPFLLALAVLAAVLTGCGTASGNDDGPEKTELSFETFGDIYKQDIEVRGYTVYQDLFVLGFSIGDELYRAAAKIPEETVQVLWDLDVDPEHDKEFHEIIDDIRIGKIENLNDQKLTRDEMDALVGKTMAELNDSGWYSTGYDLSAMKFWMSYGPYIYAVTFTGEVPESQYEDFNEYEDMTDNTVKSVEFYMIGDATDVDIDTYSID